MEVAAQEQNKAPDSICNYVMYHRCYFIRVDLDATRFKVRPNIYIYIYIYILARMEDVGLRKGLVRRAG